ncbi:hypothetical protein [Maricaulis salignorans]|uniref:Uncharacterized protein n=1 Tax=Maricaulis salignorans TaxID=144026 RepID=A0A1G9U245_9PROT|nr:hypothetical protein [Maricaulis salignorans]SDM53863.1 hypothetical protein SAMN04488568_11384 [Maricaulis salignorans]
MAVGMSVDLEREIRIFVFSETVIPADFDFVARLYGDRENYRFTDREIVFFTPDVSMAQIETEDIGGLADSYFEALRARNDTKPDRSIWVMPDHVRNDARLWREFTREPENHHKSREYMDNFAAALAAYDLPSSWLDDIRQGRGLREFGQVAALRNLAPLG